MQPSWQNKKLIIIQAVQLWFPLLLADCAEPGRVRFLRFGRRLMTAVKQADLFRVKKKMAGEQGGGKIFLQIETAR